MATTKLSTDVIDLSDNTEALLIPKGASSNIVDTTSTCNYPTTALALYQFEGNAADTCNSNQYPGTANAVTYTSGKFGQAADLTATNGSISIPGLTASQFSANISVSVWVNMTSLVASGKGIYLFSVSSGNFQIQVTSSGINFYKYDTANYAASYSTTLNLGQWYHIVATASTSTGMKLYLNGSEVGSNGYTGAINTDLNDIGWGYYYLWDDRRGFSGLIDQGRLFPSALTPAQVTQLYNESNIPTTNGRPTSPTEGLMRENTTTGKMEFYNGSLWQEITDTASTYSPIVIPAANFNTVEYNGNGSTQDINIVGFKSDLTWIKNKVSNGNNNVVFDSIRGPEYGLRTSTVGTPNYNAGYRLTAWDDDGFSVTDISAGNYNVNGNSGWAGAGEFVAWNWKAGGAAVPNSVGTNTNSSDVSANVAAGFSIVKVVADGTNNTIGHGLGGIPELIISKNIGVDGAWGVYSAPTGLGYYMYLNQTTAVNAIFDVSVYTSVSSTTFAPGSGGWNSTNGNTYIHYLWRSIPGYSKIGFYVGNGSVTGPEIYTGFKPAWLLIRRYDSGDNWLVFDNKRNTSNPRNLALVPNNDAAESVGNLGQGFSFVSTGFQVASSDSGVNASGGKFIYMTFAE